MKSIKIKILVLISIATIFFIAGKHSCLREQNASAAGNCDTGYQGVGDFCIEKEVHGGSEEWGDAALVCYQDDEARLCTSYELVTAGELAHDGIITLTHDVGSSGREWVDDFVSSTEALALDHYKDNFDYDDMSSTHAFRCCKNKL